jgi:HAD superfamily hydrolase (TIGR01509 family)
MEKVGAFIFDLNGTMIDDMKFHTKAWYHILNDELGKHLEWDEVKNHMYGKNSEVLERLFGKDYFNEEEVERISIDKEKRYQHEFFPYLGLITGLSDFLENATVQGLPIAIGSAAIPFNINFVLDNLNIRHFFKAIVSADDVKLSKPHPETFLKAAQSLKIPASTCIVFEDAPKGVESALNAGMRAVVITTTHDAADFKDYPNVIGFIKDFNDPFCGQLLQAEQAHLRADSQKANLVEG